MYKIFYLIVALLIIIDCIEFVESKNVTQYRKSFHRLLSRRKRFVVFPVGGSILITPSVLKHLVSIYPRGLLMSLEIDCYNNLPESIDGYRPKLFDKPAKTQTSQSKPEPPKIIPMHMETDELPPSIIEHFHHHHHNETIDHPHSGEIIDDTEFRARFPQYKPTPMTSNRRNWINYNSQYKNYVPFKGNYNRWNNFSNMPQSLQSLHRRPFLKNWKPNYAYSDQKFSYYRPNRRIYRPIVNYQNQHGQIYRNDAFQYPDLRGHRDRREIFTKFEEMGTIFGLNLKACILRAICESRHFLLPPGVSLIQDIIRILLTVPTKSEFTDEYSQATRHDKDECEAKYSKICPYSILAFALQRKNIWKHN